MFAVATETPRSRELDELTRARAVRGDEGAFRELVRHHQRAVFGVLWRTLGRRAGRELVEDLAQETSLAVHRALPGFRPDGPARLSTWILTIAARAALKELRRRPPPTEPLNAARELAGGEPADLGAARRRLGAAIADALDRLPPDHRAVFVLREYADLEYGEIASALDLELGTVKSRLSRARAELKAALAEEMR